MPSFDRPLNETTVAATTLPQKVWSTNGVRQGVHLVNRAATDMYVKVVIAGATAPTFAQMVTAGAAQYGPIASNDDLDIGCRQDSDVYVCLASGTGNITGWELL